MSNRHLTASCLRSRLHYSPLSGRFTWLAKSGDDRLTNSWNARYAGAQAGSLDRGGYIDIALDGKRYTAGRLAWLWMTGAFPAECIDHKNGNPSDNRWENLREATVSQNCANKAAFNASGLKGAYTYPYLKGKWTSTIRVGGKSQHLGTFETAQAAHEAYVKAAIDLHGEFARY